MELAVGGNVSTDEILPAGARVLPFRSNIPKLAEFTYYQVDEDYAKRAFASKDSTGHIIVGGANYGQGPSREHAAITPRYLGLHIVLAESYARIRWQNLTNFEGLRESIAQGPDVRVHNMTRNEEYAARHSLSERQVEIVLAGGVIPWLRTRA